MSQQPMNGDKRKRQPAGRSNKRRKPRWKERVAPRTDAEDAAPEEGVIDEAVLTRCTRCPAHRRRTGRFRPLIGNQGDYLCDGCYRREFPATAMLDDADAHEVRRLGSRAVDFLRDKIADGVADATGAARAAAPRGEDDKDLEFPSEVECRTCLDRGSFRRCCDGYYCHSCYYRSARCPGCGAEAHLTGVAVAKTDPGKVAVGLSWALSFLLVAIAGVCLALVSFNAYTSPKTVWGHTCRGWFPVCNLAVCVDYDGGGGYGESGDFIPAAQPYKVCDRELSASRVVGSACVYDREMYEWSNTLLGYDMCTSSPREEGQRPRNVSSPDPLLLHVHNQSGVYVFDDDFELPLRPHWTEVVNGNLSGACGVNNNPPERGNHGGFQPAVNEHALVFTGVQARHAATVDLNIQFGGRMEFFLKMGDTDTDDDAECKTAFSDVLLDYKRANVSPDWVPFATYEAWRYRGQTFQFVSREIPPEAWSNSTRFRFRQAYPFDVLRDHWAIDDVRILANLKPQWEDSGEFRKRQLMQDGNVKLAQCCYNSDQCSLFDKRRIRFDKEGCRGIPLFDKSKSVSSRMKLSEVRVLFLCLVVATKALYRFAVRRFTESSSTTDKDHFQDVNGVDDVESEKELFPRRTYISPSHSVWQYTIAFIINGVFACTVFHLLVSLSVFGCNASSGHKNADGGVLPETNVAVIYTCLFAGAFDMKAIGVLLSKVFYIGVPWKHKPLKVMVDLHPERGYMQVGKLSIPLSNVSDITSQSPSFHGFLSAVYVLNGFPFALFSLLLSSSRGDGGAHKEYATLLGSVAILREIFGPFLFVKIYLSIGWVLAHSYDDRDELGRSLLKEGLFRQSVVGSMLTPIIVFSILLSRRVEHVTAMDNFFVFLVSFSAGGLLGLLRGVLRELPVSPEACLAGPPSPIVCVVFRFRSKRSQKILLVLALDDMYSFKRMLLGNLSSVPVPTKES